MERPIKGGYILVSLGLIALSTSYSGSIDYDRISKTKKHIVLTGIKVGDTVMPDICVKPVYGNGTITFEDVYGFDVVVSSNNSVSVSESSVAPNVEKAPLGIIVNSLGLDEDGKVVKGASSGLKMYKHFIRPSEGVGELIVYSLSASPFTGLENKELTDSFIRARYNGPTSLSIIIAFKSTTIIGLSSTDGTVVTVNFSGVASDTVTEL